MSAEGRGSGLAGRTVLVTGALGCIGAWTVKRLLARGAEVVVFDRGDDMHRLRSIMHDEEIVAVRLVRGDIAERGALGPVLREIDAAHVIHLAGLQVPSCRADPHAGALVNVAGTINVFEAVRGMEGRISRVVYASSAAVFGAAGPGAPPSTHYGAFKRCNEENARVYYLDHGVSSIGLRPLTVYGVGRDFGLTADPTKAMKAAAAGRPFHIRFGGRTDFQYVVDTADTFIRAATSDLDGAHVFDLHGESVAVARVVAEIERAAPGARGTITHEEAPLALPEALDDSAIRDALGPLPATPLAAGVRETVEAFAALRRAGRLDTSDLDA